MTWNSIKSCQEDTYNFLERLGSDLLGAEDLASQSEVTEAADALWDSGIENVVPGS